MFTLKGAGLAAVWYEMVPLKLNSFPLLVNISKKKASLISDESKSSLDDDMAAILLQHPSESAGKLYMIGMS